MISRTKIDFEAVRAELKMGFPSLNVVQVESNGTGAQVRSKDGTPHITMFIDDEGCTRFKVGTASSADVRRFWLLFRSAGLTDEQVINWKDSERSRKRLTAWFLGRLDPSSLLKAYSEATKVAWTSSFFEARVRDLTMAPNKTASPEALADAHATAAMETFTLAEDYPSGAIEDWVKKVG